MKFWTEVATVVIKAERYGTYFRGRDEVLGNTLGVRCVSEKAEGGMTPKVWA